MPRKVAAERVQNPIVERHRTGRSHSLWCLPGRLSVACGELPVKRHMTTQKVDPVEGDAKRLACPRARACEKVDQRAVVVRHEVHEA